MILVMTAVIDTRQDTKFTLWTAGSGQVRCLVSDVLMAGIFCTLAVCMCKIDSKTAFSCALSNMLLSVCQRKGFKRRKNKSTNKNKIKTREWLECLSEMFTCLTREHTHKIRLSKHGQACPQL